MRRWLNGSFSDPITHSASCADIKELLRGGWIKPSGPNTKKKNVPVKFLLHNLFPTETNTLKARWYLICLTHTLTDSTVEQKSCALPSCQGHIKESCYSEGPFTALLSFLTFQARVVATKTIISELKFWHHNVCMLTTDRWKYGWHIAAPLQTSQMKSLEYSFIIVILYFQ